MALNGLFCADVQNLSC